MILFAFRMSKVNFSARYKIKIPRNSADVLRSVKSVKVLIILHIILPAWGSEERGTVIGTGCLWKKVKAPMGNQFHGSC